MLYFTYFKIGNVFSSKSFPRQWVNFRFQSSCNGVYDVNEIQSKMYISESRSWPEFWSLTRKILVSQFLVNTGNLSALLLLTTFIPSRLVICVELILLFQHIIRFSSGYGLCWIVRYPFPPLLLLIHIKQYPHIVWLNSHYCLSRYRLFSLLWCHVARLI